MKSALKYNCIFGGGGIRGLCYVGAIKALEELDIELCSLAGSSVGAVFSAFYAVGYSAEEIKNFFFEFNINMFRDINISLFPNDISISKGEIFLDWIREKLGKKVYGESYSKDDYRKVTFNDLKKDLSILTIDLNTNTPFIFSKNTTPDEEVAIAVRASAGLPGLLKPVNYNGCTLVDGDLIKSWPAWKIYNDFNESDCNILEFRLEGSNDGKDIKNPMDYLDSIINTIWYLSTENVYNSYSENDKYDFIVIDTKDVIMFDFTVNAGIKEALVEKGYQTAKKYFLKTLLEKKKIISDKYNNISISMEKLIKEIKKKNYNESLIALNEIMSNSFEYSKYVDKIIYEQMTELKLMMNSAQKKQLLFSQTFKNEKPIEEKAQFIKMLLRNKIENINIYLQKFSNIC